MVPVKQRDEVKQLLCDKNGITLIVVPYWWNKSMESVAQTIHMMRPDIKISPYLLKGDPISNYTPPQRNEKGIFLHNNLSLIVFKYRIIQNESLCSSSNTVTSNYKTKKNTRKNDTLKRHKEQ